MADGFYSGNTPIPSGVDELTISDLELSFVPASVQVSIRQPDADADIINGYVAGDLSTDGFKVIFSATIPQTGYSIDWVAYKGGIGPAPGEDTLQLGYADLKKSVSRFLGYNPSALNEMQEDEVDGYIQSGLRNFYYPPKMEGTDENFEWSFLKMSGEVQLTAGVGEYRLPNGFGRIAGQLIFKDAQARKTLPVIPYGDVKQMVENSPNNTGRPRFAAVISEKAFGTKGQYKNLIVFPKPDKDYCLEVVGDSDCGKLDEETNIYPLGGAMFSELVEESCLAIAEQKANDEMGLHTLKFNSLLISMIARDRKSTAQVFGKVGDPKFKKGMW